MDGAPAAGQRFRTQGFAATSLDDLSAATGLNRLSLYSAFGDKKAIYLAALDRTRSWLTAQLDALIAANYPMDRMLHAFFLGAIDVYLSGESGPSGCIAINTATAESVTDPDIRAALAEILRIEDEKLTVAMRNAGSNTPQAHARIATSVMHSLSVRARSGTPRKELIALAKETTALLAGQLEPALARSGTAD